MRRCRSSAEAERSRLGVSGSETMMERVRLAPIGALRMFVLTAAFAVMLLFLWASVAEAQSRAFQYGEQLPPQGISSGSGIQLGAPFSVPGDLSAVPDASMVLEDADGTMGTFVRGTNAEVEETDDGLRVTPNAEPMNVSGGDDSLAPDGLSVAATTGVSEDADQEDEQDEQPPPKAATTSEDQAAPESGGVSVLPDTGGPILLVLLSGLAVAATGLALIRRRR